MYVNRQIDGHGFIVRDYEQLQLFFLWQITGSRTTNSLFYFSEDYGRQGGCKCKSLFIFSKMFFMSGLNRAHLAFASINISLREFERYRDQMERYFVQERARIDDEFKTLDPTQVDDSDYAMDYMDYLSECYRELETSFPNNFRSSFLIQIISFIEYELKKICNLHSEYTNSVFKLKDLRGNGEFDQMKNYLQKVANIDFNTVSPEWELLQKIYKVRNKFVHQTGLVQSKDTDMETTLRSLQHVSKKIEAEVQEPVMLTT